MSGLTITLTILIPIIVIIASASVQWFAKNTLAITGATLVLFMLLSVIMLLFVKVEWPILVTWAIMYYFLSFVGCFIGTLCHKGYDKFIKKSPY